MKPMLAKQVVSTLREPRTVSGMIGCAAYLVSTIRKAMNKMIDRIIGSAGMSVEAKLYRSKIVEPV